MLDNNSMYDSIWYEMLNKPALTPPAQVFPIVWIALYIMMALSLILYTKNNHTESKTFGIAAFIVQLVLNIMWSPIFFNSHNIRLAFLVIILLSISILLTIVIFYRNSKLAAILLIPYFLWVVFATYLNYGFMRLNT